MTPTPQMQAGLAAFKAAMEASMPPRQVADQVFDAIKKEQFYILSDPEWTEVIRLRTDSLTPNGKSAKSGSNDRETHEQRAGEGRGVLAEIAAVFLQDAAVHHHR